MGRGAHNEMSEPTQADASAPVDQRSARIILIMNY